MNDQLIFKIADCMQTELYLVDTKVRGLIKGHSINIGGVWTLKEDVTIYLDETSSSSASAFIRVCGDLWCYLTASSSGMMAAFFDNTKAKVKVGAEEKFGLGDSKKTLNKLHPCITRVFVSPLKGSNSKWEAVDKSVLAA